MVGCAPAGCLDACLEPPVELHECDSLLFGDPRSSAAPITPQTNPNTDRTTRSAAVRTGSPSRRPASVDLVEVPYDRRIGTTRGGVLHRTRAGQPSPVRGATGVLR